ncbi:NUDIX hydrolase [uncultured Dubosiella sp.]|uniref:NUDIX hydrolase n=1 Tax=uncultured Dubosiella sp. TaxID=1937011 RepID=UPI0025927AC5|nr:NUDIX hydrolase [uncultured Dubosiella sp.]
MNAKPLQPWKTVNTKTIVDNPWLKVQKNEVELASQMRIPDFYTVTIPDASAVVALDENENVILKREYRYAQQKELIEIPAGAFDDRETDPLAVAKRELREETGYVSSHWIELGATVDCSAKLTNTMHLFLALSCTKAGTPELDATEDVETLLVPFAQAIDMVMRNEICCNSSSAALLKAQHILQKREKQSAHEKRHDRHGGLSRCRNRRQRHPDHKPRQNAAPQAGNHANREK